MPVFLDTDTSVVGNTNWRGSSGGQLVFGANVKGIIPTLVVLAPNGTVVAGTVTVTDPQQTSGNLLKYNVTASFVGPIEIPIGSSGALWRDFVVTGLTATVTSLQIWYKY